MNEEPAIAVEGALESDGSRTSREPPVMVPLFDLVAWYGERTERFPRALRVTLGDRIDDKLLGMLESAVRAKYARDPRRHLEALNMEVQVLRYLTRVAVRRECLTLKQYEHVARELQSIGRQTGGWLKSVNHREKRQAPV